MDDAAHLAAILANPDDDAARQVWADALQARGEPRGELIALQVAQARASGREAAALARQADEVLADHEDALIPKALADVPPGRLELRRGFVEHVVLDAATFEARADALFAATPLLDLELTGLTVEQAGRLAALPHLARLRSLTVHDSIPTRPAGELDEAAATLLASPHLGNLRRLAVGADALVRVPDVLARRDFPLLEEIPARLAPGRRAALLASAALPALTEQTLRYEPLDDALIAALHAPHRRDRLAALHLVGCKPPDGTIARLVAADLPALRHLEIRAWQVNLADQLALADADLPALRELDLTYSGLRPEALVALLGSPRRTLLQVLIASSNPAGRALAEALRGSAVAGLRRLELVNGQVDAAGAVALGASPLGALEVLRLGQCAIGDEGVRALAAATALGELRELDLDQTKPTEAGIRALAEATGLRGLRRLSLHNVTLGEAGAAALGEASGLSRLRELTIGFEKVSRAPQLVRAPVMAGLETLHVASYDPDGVAAALAANPDARRLRRLDLRWCQQTGADLLAIARSPFLTRLRDLDGTFRLAPADAHAVAAAPGLRRIRRLTVSLTVADDAARAALSARFGPRLY